MRNLLFILTLSLTTVASVSIMMNHEAHHKRTITRNDSYQMDLLIPLMKESQYQSHLSSHISVTSIEHRSNCTPVGAAGKHSIHSPPGRKIFQVELAKFLQAVKLSWKEMCDDKPLTASIEMI